MNNRFLVTLCLSWSLLHSLCHLFFYEESYWITPWTEGVQPLLLLIAFLPWLFSYSVISVLREETRTTQVIWDMNTQWIYAVSWQCFLVCSLFLSYSFLTLSTSKRWDGIFTELAKIAPRSCSLMAIVSILSLWDEGMAYFSPCAWNFICYFIMFIVYYYELLSQIFTTEFWFPISQLNTASKSCLWWTLFVITIYPHLQISYVCDKQTDLPCQWWAPALSSVYCMQLNFNPQWQRGKKTNLKMQCSWTLNHRNLNKENEFKAPCFNKNLLEREKSNMTVGSSSYHPVVHLILLCNTIMLWNNISAQDPSWAWALTLSP